MICLVFLKKLLPFAEWMHWQKEKRSQVGGPVRLLRTVVQGRDKRDLNYSDGQR